MSAALPQRPTDSASPRARRLNQRQRFIERRRFFLQIAVFQPLGDARRVGFNDEYRRARHHACERLRTAHAAETGGQNEFPGERIVEMLAGNLHENFKRRGWGCDNWR